MDLDGSEDSSLRAYAPRFTTGCLPACLFLPAIHMEHDLAGFTAFPRVFFSSLLLFLVNPFYHYYQGLPLRCIGCCRFRTRSVCACTLRRACLRA